MKLRVPLFVSAFNFEGHSYKVRADGSCDVPDHAVDALKCVGLQPWVDDIGSGTKTAAGGNLSLHAQIPHLTTISEEPPKPSRSEKMKDAWARRKAAAAMADAAV